MKKIVFSIMLFSTSVFCQTAKDPVKNAEIKMNFSTYFNPLTHLREPLLEDQFDKLDFSTGFLADSASIMTLTRMQMSSFYNDYSNQAKNSLLNPLYQSFVEAQKYKWIKEIIGAVELGAVGCLAYEHLRKYTFKKKD